MALRVVGAGLGRTGTNSLMTALEMILPGECHHMYQVFAKDEAATWRDIARDQNMALLDEVMTGYVASVDWPSSAFWEHLANANPGALILLSVRESCEKWFKSASDTIFQGIDKAEGVWKEMVDALFDNTFTRDIFDKDKAIAAYEAHNDYVRKNADPARLLEWQATDGWEPICERLGLPVPAAPFPHTNSTEDFLKMRGGN